MLFHQSTAGVRCGRLANGCMNRGMTVVSPGSSDEHNAKRADAGSDRERLSLAVLRSGSEIELSGAAGLRSPVPADGIPPATMLEQQAAAKAVGHP